MDQKTLKRLRLIVPGFILILEFLPLLNTLNIEYKIGEGWMGYSFLIIPAVVVGVIYHLMEIRNFVTGYSHRKIDLNITSSLLKMYNRDVDQEERVYLKEKRLKHIFYYFIDSDPSLTAKSRNVYFNGLLWSSTADLFIISIFTSLTYLILYFSLTETIFIYFFLTAGASLIGFLLHILTVYKHINLSNEQLEYIETHYVIELNTKMDEVLHRMPKS